MRRANVVSGVVLAVLGLVMLVAIIPWQIEAGPDDMMSPRLVPAMMMVVVTGLSVMLAIGNLRSPRGEDGAEADAPPVSASELMALLRIGAIFAIALALFRFVSPLAAGAALVALSLFSLGERRPAILLLMPAGLLLALWLLFYKVLGTAIV